MVGAHSSGGSIRIGKILGKRYELLEILGSGVISTVYKARDRHKSKANSEEHYVTVKVLNKQYQSTQAWLLALAQVLRKCKYLNHPNIAKGRGIRHDGATVYLLMEYLSGESLGQKISSGRAEGMPVRQALRIVNEIGRALIHAHERGILHNDLKPANVFLTDSGQVKVIDFGIAHTLRKTAKENESASHFGPDDYSVSTPSYASPELLDLKKTDSRADVYALACIAYELLAGRHPFGRVRATGARDSALELRPSPAFTKNQWSILQKALAFNQKERTPTVEEFLAGFNTSATWQRRVSLTAGIIALAVAVSFFYSRSQIPQIEDWSAEPEAPVTPNLTDSGDRDQLVSLSGPVPQPKEVVELIVETQITADEQNVPEQTAIADDVEQITDDVEQVTDGEKLMSEQEITVTERSSPAQDNKVWPAEIENVPIVQTADEQLLVQPIVADGKSWVVQPEKSVARDDEFAAITEMPFKPIAEKGLPDSEESQSPDAFGQSLPDAIGQSLREKMTQAITETQALDEALPEREKAAYHKKIPHSISRPPVVINEFMTSNDQTISDAQGGYDDWIELYNRTQETIDLSGRYLSDNPKKLKQWRFPNGTRIGPNSYLLIWADRSSSYTDMTAQPPELHANFELSRRAEQILLVDSDENGNAIIDRISYGRQREDWSMERYPNGTGEFSITHAPTPGRANLKPRR